jgi:ribose-phosphate pyrophosphokinase
MIRAAEACVERGASRIFLAATHGLFHADSAANLSAPFIDGICVSNTVDPSTHIDQLETVDVTALFAQAIGANFSRSDP